MGLTTDILDQRNRTQLQNQYYDKRKNEIASKANHEFYRQQSQEIKQQYLTQGYREERQPDGTIKLVSPEREYTQYALPMPKNPTIVLDKYTPHIIFINQNGEIIKEERYAPFITTNDKYQLDSGTLVQSATREIRLSETKDYNWEQGQIQITQPNKQEITNVQLEQLDWNKQQLKWNNPDKYGREPLLNKDQQQILTPRGWININQLSPYERTKLQLDQNEIQNAQNRYQQLRQEEYDKYKNDQRVAREALIQQIDELKKQGYTNKDLFGQNEKTKQFLGIGGTTNDNTSLQTRIPNNSPNNMANNNNNNPNTNILNNQTDTKNKKNLREEILTANATNIIKNTKKTKTKDKKTKK